MMRTTEKHKNETNRDGWQSKKKKKKLGNHIQYLQLNYTKVTYSFVKKVSRKKKAKFKIKYTM